jgi:two-component system sensor histidine kinase/response regulator
VPDISEPRRPDGTAGHVLLAEHNPLDQRVAEAMLRHLGFTFDVVADGATAVAAAMSTNYRAIVMACELPVMDGYDATAEIRRREESRIPIIAITGAAGQGQHQWTSAGMDDHVSKPLNLAALADVLARWVPPAPRERTATPANDADGAPVVLDATIIRRLERLGEATGQDLMGQLATLFLADADDRIRELREALACHHAEAVVRSAHTLSGSGANLGATELARLCATLSMPSAAADPVYSMTLFDRIEAELSRVRSALRLLVASA